MLHCRICSADHPFVGNTKRNTPQKLVALLNPVDLLIQLLQSPKTVLRIDGEDLNLTIDWIHGKIGNQEGCTLSDILECTREVLDGCLR